MARPKKPRQGLSLPKDLREFVTAGRQLDYDAKTCECGRVTLLPVERLRVQQFPIVTDEMQEVWGDPRRGKGHYRVPAVNLVEACEHYDPLGILIWIPAEGLFGCWDSDHCVMKVFPPAMQVFPAATWADIVASPVRYLNAQWSLDATTSKLLIPWPSYPWKPGRPRSSPR